MAEHTLTIDQSEALLDDDALGEDDDAELCGATTARGNTCDNLAEECPWHD